MSSVQDVQRQLLDTVTEMGANLDILMNTEKPASPTAQSATNDRVADLVSSRTSLRGLSPLMEEEEDDDVDDKRETFLGQKTTTLKVLLIGRFGGPM